LGDNSTDQVVQGVSERAITNNAVVFFDSNNSVAKEMLYTEFEAVLDHIVGVPDFEGQKINAVYLQINQHLQVTAAVFFQVGFDSKGYTDNLVGLTLEIMAREKAVNKPPKV
jgi:hypothetical protein